MSKTKKRRYRQLSRADVKMIRALKREGAATLVIAKRMRASKSSVYNVLVKNTHATVR
jgi:predicted transcriptional regulator